MIVDSHVHVGPWRLSGLEELDGSLDLAVETALGESVGGMAVTRSDGGDNASLRAAVAAEQRLDLWYLPWARPGTAEAAEAFSSPGPRPSMLKLHPALDRVPVTDPRYDTAFEVATARDVPVLIHTGRWQEVAGFAHALERAARHPRVRVVLAHAGGNDFALRLRCAESIEARRLDNVWLDLTGLGMPLLSRRLVERLGPERFLFGSDFPLGHPRVQLAHVTAMGLPAEATDAILGGNALGLLGPPSNRGSNP